MLSCSQTGPEAGGSGQAHGGCAGHEGSNHQVGGACMLFHMRVYLACIRGPYPHAPIVCACAMWASFHVLCKCFVNVMYRICLQHALQDAVHGGVHRPRLPPSRHIQSKPCLHGCGTCMLVCETQRQCSSMCQSAPARHLLAWHCSSMRVCGAVRGPSRSHLTHTHT